MVKPHLPGSGSGQELTSMIKDEGQGRRCCHPLRSKASPRFLWSPNHLKRKSKTVEKLNRATTPTVQYLAFPLPKPLKPPYKAICFICWYLEREEKIEWVASRIIMSEVSTKSPFFLIHRISTCVACRWWPYHHPTAPLHSRSCTLVLHPKD